MNTKGMSLRSGHTTAITVDGLSKSYSNGVTALHDCSFSLPYGSLVALLGPNGAGKSTLINLLAGAIQPSSGSIALPGSAQNVAWSNQRPTIDWYLSVRQNIRMGPRLYGRSRSESNRTTDATIDYLGLTEHADSFPDMLSGGQQQRVQVARTLATGANVLLLDEPTVGLDVESSESALRYIKSRVGDGSLVVISSHDLGLLEKYCDHVLLLVKGELVAHQPMRDFVDSNTTVEITRIHYDGQLSGATIDRIRKEVIEYEEGNPLTIATRERISLAAMARLLGEDVELTDIERENNSLREVYMSLVRP